MLTIFAAILVVLTVYSIVEYFRTRPSKNAVRAEIIVGKISNKNENKEK